MAKKKSKPKKTRKSRVGDQVAKLELGWLSKKTTPPENRHAKVSLAMASLIAGLVLLVNFDSSTNAAAATRDGGGTSFHGWPAVYLERRYESLPAYLMAGKINPWPIPVQEGEVRTMNFTNLWIDMGVGIAIVIISFFGIRWLVLRYDNWKKTWT
ncbi:MAG: hypothetical protein AB8B55_13490 [Mariniblastus sp.]